MKKYIWILITIYAWHTIGWAQTNIPNQGKLHSINTPITINEHQSRTGTTLTYLDMYVGASMSFFGFGKDTPLNLTALTYFPADIISQYEGDTIKMIRAIGPPTNAALGEVHLFKIGIWTDTTNACAHPVYEQEVSEPSPTLMNDIELTTPYILGNEPIFIGYKIIGKGYIITAENDPADVNENGYGDMLVEPNGHLIHMGNTGCGDLTIMAFVGTPDPIDISLTSVTPSTFIGLGNTIISGTVKNNGTNMISSYDVRYKIDNGEFSPIHSIQDTILPNSLPKTFSHPDSAYFGATGKHTIELEISNVNGGDEIALDDNRMIVEIEAFNEIYTRRVVYEELSSTSCGWCPRGIVALNTMAHEITDNTWIGITTHTYGPLSLPEYFNALNLTGTPTGRLNRLTTQVSPALVSLKHKYEECTSNPSKAKIDITAQTWDEATRQFTVEAAVNFCADMDSVDYNLALIVVEDSIKGNSPEYAQSNFYSNRIDLIDWDGTNWRNLPNPVPAEQMCYNHIARQLIGGFDGVSGIIPSTVNYGTTYKHTFSGYIPETHNPLFTNYVALIIDNTDGHIVNATQVHSETEVGITEEDNPHNIRLYPNPSTGMLTIDNIPERAEIHIYNVLGNMVYQQQYNNMIKRTIIDLSDLPTGNYIVNIIGQDKVFSEKIVLAK